MSYTEKLARDMPSFTAQDRPEKVKEIYRALTREHGESAMPASVKARIAIRKGRKTKQARKPPETGGPAYKDPITHTLRGDRYVKTAAANFAKTAFAGTGAVAPMMYGSGGAGAGGMRGGMAYAKGGMVVPKTSKNLAKRLAGRKGAAARKAMTKKAGMFKAVTKGDPGAHKAPGKLWKLVSVLTGGQVRKPTKEVAQHFARRGL